MRVLLHFSESFQHQHWIMPFQKPSMRVKWSKIVVEQDNWSSAISSEWRCPPSWWPTKEPLCGRHISLPPQQNEAHMQQKYVCIYASNWGVEPKLTHPKGSIGILLWTILQWYNDSLLMSNQAGFNGLVQWSLVVVVMQGGGLRGHLKEIWEALDCGYYTHFRPWHHFQMVFMKVQICRGPSKTLRHENKCLSCHDSCTELDVNRRKQN